MKLKASLFSLLFIPILANAQYEQKVSLALSAGTFKTFGNKVGVYGPMQMPNYGMGFSASGGLQFRINERLSLSAEIGIMLTQRWFYAEGDNNNFLYWSILDTVTNDLIADGENYLDLRNYSFGLKPKYYLIQGKKWNPYLFLGISINLISAYFENNWWWEMEWQGLLPPGETELPPSEFLEKNIGIGLNPGLGIEYSPSNRMHFYLTSGYYFIALNKDNFKSPELEEHFHAIILQVGSRINFIKTKDL